MRTSTLLDYFLWLGPMGLLFFLLSLILGTVFTITLWKRKEGNRNRARFALAGIALFTASLAITSAALTKISIMQNMSQSGVADPTQLVHSIESLYTSLNFIFGASIFWGIILMIEILIRGRKVKPSH